MDGLHCLPQSLHSFLTAPLRTTRNEKQKGHTIPVALRSFFIFPVSVTPQDLWQAAHHARPGLLFFNSFTFSSPQ
jgi:hypothetical protein